MAKRQPQGEQPESYHCTNLRGAAERAAWRPDVMNIAPTPIGAAEWRSGYATAIGGHHARTGIPCQDAAKSAAGPRPFVMVCDGRGSSRISHHGSATALQTFERAAWCIEPLLSRCLDVLHPDDPLALAGWRDAAHVLLRALVQAQEVLGHEKGVSPSEFEFTLSAAVVGSHGVGILQVGDSCLLLRRGGTMALAARPQTGAFVSETYFVSPGAAVYRQAETPLLSAEGLTGIVGFSDGVSERWLHQLTSNPAPGVFQVLDRLASGDWDVARLDHYLEQPFWRLGGDDDRSVAYLVRPHGVQSTRVGPIGDTV